MSNKKQPSARDYRIARAFFEEHFENAGNDSDLVKELLDRVDVLRYHTQKDQLTLTFDLTQPENEAQPSLLDEPEDEKVESA